MKFTAFVKILPHQALLDTQGKAVTSAMTNLKLPEIYDVRIGKYMKLQVECDDVETAKEKVNEACKQLLCNPIMETYEFEIITN